MQNVRYCTLWRFGIGFGIGFLGWISPGFAACLSPAGDITGDGATNVTDVQCNIILNLWSLGGQVDTVPNCVKTAGSPSLTSDHNCDNVVNVSDTLLAVSFALGQLLDTSIDGNQNGCADGCETDTDGDGDFDFTDCAPYTAGISGTSPELCNGHDDDCDGVVDEANAPSVTTSCQNNTVCDGTEVCKVYPTTVGLVFSELMINPQGVSDESGEWLEIYNGTSAAINLRKYILKFGDGTTHTIDPGAAIFVPAKGYLTLGRNADKSINGGVLVGYVYDGLLLGNISGTIVLLNPAGAEITRVDWGAGWPLLEGASTALKDTTQPINFAAQWALSTTAYSPQNKGTPAGANVGLHPSYCVSQPGPVCEDNNGCTTDTCSPTLGCQFPPNTTACSDGNVCTQGDVCVNGACQPGTATNCNDNNICTADACDPITGCTYTPAINPCGDGGLCIGGICQGLDIVISEVLYDAPGVDTTAFIELFGPAGTPLTGYSLVGINGSGGGAYVTIPLSGAIPANGFFVVALPGSTATVLAEADMLHANADLQNGPDSLRLVGPAGTILDAVGYGTFTATDVFAGETNAAPDPSGTSITRDSTQTDTDINADDFFAAITLTPGGPTPTQNILPTAALTCPTYTFVGQLLTFSAAGSGDPDGDVVSYTFDFGDNTAALVSPSPSVSHVLEAFGAVVVKVTVTDDLGGTAVAQCTVTTQTLAVGAPAEVAAGRVVTCGISTLGEIRCWGGNILDSLGIGSEGSQINKWNYPVEPMGLSGPAKTMFVGGEIVCVLMQNATVQCWGNIFDAWYPKTIVMASNGSPMTGVLSLEPGMFNGWARQSSGNYLCFGSNNQSQCGVPWTNKTLNAQPDGVVGAEVADTLAKKRESGGPTSFQLNNNGQVWLWGNDLGSDDYGWVAKKVSLPGNAIDLAAGLTFECVILTDGTVHCGGNNTYGQLGLGTNAVVSELGPKPVVGLPAAAEKIYAKGLNACAKLVDGTYWCWGSNQYGQLGIGEDGAALPFSTSPVLVDTLPEGVVQLSVGQDHMCVLTDEPRIWCWGANTFGQLGDGTFENKSLPTPAIWNDWP